MNLILAAGSQMRWDIAEKSPIVLPKFKQLVKVGDEILIERIQRQFPGIVVTKTPEIKRFSHKWFEPEFNNVTIATLFSTRDLWEGWVTVLLGDTVYGDKTCKLIKNQTQNLMFYGDKGEIYALKFAFKISFKIIQAIHNIVNSEDFKPKYGKLWNLYRQLNGFDFREHRIGLWFTFVSDCIDFDNKKQYLKYAKHKQI